MASSSHSSSSPRMSLMGHPLDPGHSCIEEVQASAGATDHASGGGLKCSTPKEVTAQKAASRVGFDLPIQSDSHSNLGLDDSTSTLGGYNDSLFCDMNMRVSMKNSFLNVDEPSAGGLDDLAMPDLIRGQTAPGIFPSGRRAIDSQLPTSGSEVPLIGLSWAPLMHSVPEEANYLSDNLMNASNGSLSYGAHSDHGSSDSQDLAATISAALGLESNRDSDVASILGAAAAAATADGPSQDVDSLRLQNQLLTNALFSIAAAGGRRQQQGGIGGRGASNGGMTVPTNSNSVSTPPQSVCPTNSSSGMISGPSTGSDYIGLLPQMGVAVGPPPPPEEGDDDINNTTVMLRNIPNKFDTRSLIEQIHLMGFENTFDFFYLPIDFRNKCNVGYAFLNFRQHSRALEFKRTFSNYRLPAQNSHKICQVCWARVQGFDKNVEHYRNSPIAEEYRPLIADATGRWIPFPKPDPHVEEIIRSRMEQEETVRASGSNNRKSHGTASSRGKESHKIFIGGLGRSTTSGVLRDHFSKFGVVKDASVVMDRTSGKSRGFGFCLFEHDVPKAVFETSHEIDGVPVAVKYYSSN